MSQTIKNLMMAAVAILALTLVLPLQGDAQSVYYGVGGSSYPTLFANGSNALDVRNGTNSQALYVYNTYTDASNYERFGLWTNRAALGRMELIYDKAGTGAAHDIWISNAGGSNIIANSPGYVESNGWRANSGGRLEASSAIAFASLGTPVNGSFAYCNDCTIANPCAGGGTGALAKRLNGVWVCN